MPGRTMSSSEFNRDSGAAKRASRAGPVIITDRGKPSHVLLTWDAYRRIAEDEKTLAEALSMPGVEDVEFDPPKVQGAPMPAVFD